MMSLGEAEASEVFKHLSPKEVQKLGEAIAKTTQDHRRAGRRGGLQVHRRGGVAEPAGVQLG